MWGEWSAHNEEALLRDNFGSNPPWWLFNLGLHLIAGLNWIINTITPAPLRVNDVALGGRTISHVLYALTDLGVADALAHGPLSIPELTKELGGSIDENRLMRTLRTAINFGFFAEVCEKGQPMRYRNNRLSAVLREDHAQSQKYMVLAQMGPLGYTPMKDLSYGIRTGGNIFQHAFQTKGSHWDAMIADHIEEDRFSRAMTDIDRICLGVLSDDIPWSRWSRAVDIAGAYGSMLASVMQAHPHIQGTLFDQPQVIKRAQLVWREKPERKALLQRTSFAPGSFFEKETLPRAESADTVYFMRLILHDWDDEQCIKILKSVRHAIGDSGASLMVIDSMPMGAAADILNRATFINDIAMMTILDGRERSSADLESLFEQSGFRLSNIYRTRSMMTAVEASPAAMTVEPPAPVQMTSKAIRSACKPAGDLLGPSAQWLKAEA